MNVNLTQPILYLLFLFVLSACKDETEISPEKLPQDTQELESLLNKEIDTDTRLAVYYQLYKNHRSTDIEQAAHYASQQRGLAEQLDNTLYLGRAYHAQGTLQEQSGEYIEAVNAYLHAIDAFEKIEYRPGVATDLNYLGLVFMRSEGYKDAIPYFEKSAQIYKESRDFKNLSIAYTNLAICLYETESYISASDNIEKAIISHRKAEVSDNERLAYLYYLLGNIQHLTKDFDGAIDQYNKAWELANISDEIKADIAYNFMNTYAQMEQDKEKSNKWLAEAKKYQMQAQNIENENLVRQYNIEGEFHQLQGNHQKAVEIFNEAIALANKDIINEPLNNTLDLLSQSYRALTDNGAKVAYEDIYQIADLKEQQQELKNNFANGLSQKALQAALNREVEAHNQRKLQASMVDRQWLIAQGAGAIVVGLLMVIMVVTINTKATKKKVYNAQKLCAVLQEKNDALSKENKDHKELLAEIRRIASEVYTYKSKNKDV